MTEYQQQIRKLVHEANRLGHCPTQVNLMESAIQIADSHGDMEEGFWLRTELISAATFAGYGEKALVAFSWCLAKYDQDPQKFPEFQLLWTYKWICEGLPKFPQVSREQIQATLMDFADRYQRSGNSLRPFFQLKTIATVLMNDYSEAIEYERKWRETERDRSYSDCRACELDWEIKFLIYIGDHEQALTKAAPIVQGSLSCAEIPHHTLAALLLPLLKLGRIDDAMEYHHKGYPMVAKNRDFLLSVGEHLFFLVATNNLVKAIGLLEKHLHWALEPVDPYSQFYFYRASYFLIKSLQDQNESTVQLILPQSFPLYSQDGCYDIYLLVNWFSQATHDLATRFDRRNGNDYYLNQLSELDQLKGSLKTPLYSIKVNH
jgi:hypothetical protein